MKKLLTLAAVLTLISCVDNRAVLGKNEYKVVDTTYISKNGFNMILEYDVIIEIDSSYYAGSLNSNKELIRVNPRKLKYKNK
jgi:metal-dependent hydrolase (beta-lactamase superfamily II)